MKLVYQYMAIFFNFQTTSNHLHPLQVENCDSNSRLVVDEDDTGKFRLERVKASTNAGTPWRWSKKLSTTVMAMLLQCWSNVYDISPTTTQHQLTSPANTRCWTNVDLMLAQSRRRWANIKSTLVQGLVFAGSIARSTVYFAAALQYCYAGDAFFSRRH